MIGNVMIRDAEPADLALLARILGGWIAATDWMPKLHSEAENLWFIGHLAERGVVRVAGLPALGFLARQGDEVDALYLAPEARRQGIGSALMAEAMAAQQMLTLWTFQANSAAQAFYGALGFVEVGRTDGDNDEGLPDVRLEWRRDVTR